MIVGTPSNYQVSQSELAAVADMKNQAFALHGLPPLDGAEVAGIVRSVYKRHQRASLHPKQGTNEALKPWAAEGISRRMWYYRKKQKTAIALNHTR